MRLILINIFNPVVPTYVQFMGGKSPGDIIRSHFGEYMKIGGGGGGGMETSKKRGENAGKMVNMSIPKGQKGTRGL